MCHRKTENRFILYNTVLVRAIAHSIFLFHLLQALHGCLSAQSALDNSDNDNTIVRFYVYKIKSTDEDVDGNTARTIIPF